MTNHRNNRIGTHRGFTLLIAIILASVALAIGLALADIAYKQVVLASAARNSQIAFYRADSAIECALYYDQQLAAFNVDNTFTGTVQCEGRNVANYVETADSGGLKTTFDVTCSPNGRSASITIYKNTSSCAAIGFTTCLYASGFNTCAATDPNRFERGLKVFY
jgi:Tfp pilus assembly protein PilX